MARLLHITDTHLAAAPETRVAGWHTQASLDAVLEHAARAPAPTAVLASGDLVHDGSAAGYARLGRMLRGICPAVFALPGNHDDPALMKAIMQYNGVHVLAPATVGQWQIIPLDSHVPGHDHGELGAPQLRWLDAWLHTHPEHAIVAVHHPPVPVGSPGLDGIGLRDGDALLRLCARHTQIAAVVFGHVHQAFETTYAHFRLLATPSTCRQFAPHSAEITEDDQPPGYRWLLLDAQGRLETRVARAPAARAHGPSAGSGLTLRKNG
jgi:Icc protein